MKRNSNSGSRAWFAIGGLIVVGMTLLIARELPALRREWRIMRM